MVQEPTFSSIITKISVVLLQKLAHDYSTLYASIHSNGVNRRLQNTSAISICTRVKASKQKKNQSDSTLFANLQSVLNDLYTNLLVKVCRW
jgi:hypothetical protein